MAVSDMYESMSRQRLLRFLLALALTFVVQASNSCITTYPEIKKIVTCTNLTFDNETILVLTNDIDRNYTEILIVKESNITILPLDSTLTSLINFTIAFFSTAHIHKIEHDAYSIMPNLTELYLSDNNIEVITLGIFDNLKKLNILDLSKNSIRTIKKDSFSGSNMRTLNLSSNYMSTWDSIVSMKKLEVLDFSKNVFTTFSLEQMPNTLKFLNLKNNKIVTFTDTGNKTLIPKLMSLDLSDNMISDLEPLPLRNLKNLEWLYLQNNNISSFPMRYFSDLNHLRHLDASHNNLKVIQGDLFETLTLLEELILSHNHIAALENEHFLYLYRLHQLYIDYNEMSTLNLNALIEPNTPLQYVSLDGNTFSCDYLSGIIQAMVDLDVIVAGGEHFESSNINGNACYKQQSAGSYYFYKSNRIPIILSVLAGVIIVLVIPWCVKYYRYSRSRRCLLEDIEIVTYTR